MMRRSWMLAGFVLAGMGALGCGSAGAQTDVSASLYGTFSESTSGGGTVQSPAILRAGFLRCGILRIRFLIGYEATYSFNRANQRYVEPVSCGLICDTPLPQSVSANAHENYRKGTGGLGPGGGSEAFCAGRGWECC